MAPRVAALALSIPDAPPLDAIGPDDLRRLVRLHLTEPLLWLHAHVAGLQRGDVLRIDPAPEPPAADLLASVIHHAQAMMIETLRVELGIQGRRVESRSTPRAIRMPVAGQARPPAEPWRGADVLVTGASSGLGQAAAQALARRGAVVHGVARRHMAPLAFPHGGRFVPSSADITRYDALEAALGRRRFAAVIHCAGSGSIDVVQNAHPDNLRRDIDTNVLGTLNVAKLACSRLERPGRLAIVSSGAAKAPWAGGVSYVTGKAAQYALAERLADRLRQDDVAVTAVLAGAFRGGASVDGLRSPVLRLLVRASALALPSAASAAREMIRDVERGRAVSTPGLMGGTTYVFGDVMHLVSKSIATTMARTRVGLPLGWLGGLSAAR